MLEGISGYIKNIAFFLIFSSFIGIILPNNKYKKYIDIVLGLVLIIVILEPLAAFVFGSARPFDKALNEISESLDQKLVIDMNLDKEARERLIHKEFKERIGTHLKTVAGRFGFVLEDLDININLETGEMEFLDMRISKSRVEPSATPVPFIRVEKINIGENMAAEAEPGEFDAFKTAVSNELGLAEVNILIRQ